MKKTNTLNPRQLLAPQTVIRDTYTIDQWLGSGHFADVYQVRHRYLGMQAMKVFDPSHNFDGEADRFYEAFLLATVSHPNIVRVFDANVLELNLERREFLTMELVHGGTLDSFINDRSTPLSLRLVLDLLSDIASALSHAHTQDPSIVHGDVKPSNILVSGSPDAPIIKLADFGLARWINPITRMSRSAGTFLYMAPEEFRGYSVPASDVFALGLVAYQLLCNRLPFRTSDLPAAAEETICRQWVQEAHQQSWQPPSCFNPAVSAKINEVVMTALSTDLATRFNAADEFLQALEGIHGTRVVHSSIGAVATSKAKQAHKLIGSAFELAESPATLPQAVKHLEEAMAMHSQLTDQFTRHLKTWRAKIEDNP